MIRTRSFSLLASAPWARLADTLRANAQGHISFQIHGLPPSVNHQYIHTRHNTRLTKEAKDFRMRVIAGMQSARFAWRPRGVVSALIVLESPLWLTKKREVRKMDADNKIKALLDAIEHATGAPDAAVWEIHVYKQAGQREATSVFLFDLGDIVDYYVSEGRTDAP